MWQVRGASSTRGRCSCLWYFTLSLPPPSYKLGRSRFCGRSGCSQTDVQSVEHLDSDRAIASVSASYRRRNSHCCCFCLKGDGQRVARSGKGLLRVKRPTTAGQGRNCRRKRWVGFLVYPRFLLLLLLSKRLLGISLNLLSL